MGNLNYPHYASLPRIKCLINLPQWITFALDGRYFIVDQTRPTSIRDFFKIQSLCAIRDRVSSCYHQSWSFGLNNPLELFLSLLLILAYLKSVLCAHKVSLSFGLKSDKGSDIYSPPPSSLQLYIRCKKTFISTPALGECTELAGFD